MELSQQQADRPRRWRWGVLAAVLALAAGGWWVTRAKARQQSIEWIEVRRDDLVLSVEVNGKLRSVDTSKLGPPQLADYWDFKVSFMAPEGQEVEEGAPVLGFDTSDLQQRLTQKIAEAEEAKKQIEKTSKNLEVMRRNDAMRLAEAEARLRRFQLATEQPIEYTDLTSQDFEIAKLDLALAQGEVAYLTSRVEAAAESAQAQLRALVKQQQRAEERVIEIREAVEQMNVKAPRDGTVIYVKNWRGESKKVGDTCWRREKVIELPDLNRLRAEGDVEEDDAGKLVVGQPVTLRLDAHPDVQFGGSVQSIWKTVRQEWRSRIKVLRLEMSLDETDRQKMRPAMRFRGKIETGRVRDALLIPIEAVFLRTDGPRVYRRTALGYEVVSVELGNRNSKYVEVLSGLDQGQSISLIDPEQSSGAGG